MGQANLARQGQPIFKISGKSTEVGELVRGIGGGWVANDKGGARKGRRKDFDVLPCKGIRCEGAKHGEQKRKLTN